MWAGWTAFLAFFRDVAKIDLPEHAAFRPWEELTLHSGPRFMHAKFWIASDFPERIGRDAENRPHSDDGPQIAWRDGWKTYAIHGVRVPGWLVEHPERITVEVIDREQNQELKRIMIAKFGLAKYAAAGTVIDEDVDQLGFPRRLLRRAMNDGSPDLMMVHVKNSTLEPDGSRKDYFLCVHPQLRPLLGDKLGEPQKLTCRNAVASTFGLRGEEYAPEVET